MNEEKFTLEEIDLLIKGLDSVSEASRNKSAFANLATVMLSKDKIEAEEKLKELDRSEAVERVRREEEMLKISILKGRLSAMKLEILREQPFAGLREVPPPR